MSEINISLTLIIIGVTAVVSMLALNNQNLLNKLKHYPVAEKGNGEFYRFLSSGFVHGSIGHLLINMYVLWTFGEVIENAFGQIFGNFGRLVFLIFYLSCIVIADIPSYFKNINNPRFASVGASGAVSGIVFIYIVFFPYNGLTFIFFPFFAIPAIYLGIGYLIYSSWASKNSQDGIDHSAHFAGAIYGLLFIFIAKPSLISSFFNQVVSGFPMG